MNTTTSPVVFEVWSEDATQRPRPSAAGSGEPRRPASPAALVVAGLLGAALASGGFVVAMMLDEARDTAAMRQQVAETLTDMVRNQDLVFSRLPLVPVPDPSTDPRGPCSPVSAERLGHC